MHQLRVRLTAIRPEQGAQRRPAGRRSPSSPFCGTAGGLNCLRQLPQHQPGAVQICRIIQKRLLRQREPPGSRAQTPVPQRGCRRLSSPQCTAASAAPPKIMQHRARRSLSGTASKARATAVTSPGSTGRIIPATAFAAGPAPNRAERCATSRTSPACTPSGGLRRCRIGLQEGVAEVSSRSTVDAAHHPDAVGSQPPRPAAPHPAPSCHPRSGCGAPKPLTGPAPARRSSRKCTGA